MNPENEDEVFERASNAKAVLNQLEKDIEGRLSEKSEEVMKTYIRDVREDLEIISRRADPARFPKGHPKRRSE